MGSNRFMYRVQKGENDKKRYRLVDIGYALKISPDAVQAYFTNKHISVKGGLTLDQIEEAILHGNLGNRGGYVQEEQAKEIETRLRDEKHILLNEEAAEQISI